MHTHKRVCKRWQQSELKYIKDNYSTISISDMSKQLKRSKKSVRAKIEGLGYRLSTLKRNDKKWKASEIRIITENPEKSIKQLAKLIPNRTYSAIYLYARKIGRKKVYKGWHLDYFGRKQISVGNGKFMAEHRFIVEQYIKRKLQKKECVHHINFDKTDNRIENLYLFESPKHHMLSHRSLEKLAKDLLERGVIWFDNNSEKYKLK